MSNRDLLVEIGLEEMPARFVTDAMNQFTSKLSNWLNESNIPFDQVKSYSTPRRLAVVVTGVSEKQNDIEIEAKGPARKIALDEAGNWTKAAIGFSRGQGGSVDDIYFKEINGVEYAHLTKQIKGQDTIQSLTQLEEIITSLSFPKNMKWGNEDFRFVRPIKWLIALFGNEIIPFSITGVGTDNKTLGHRFLGTEVEIHQPQEYEGQLLEQFVLANPVERKEAIRTQIRHLADEQDWIVPVDEDLLEEVTNLIEYPTALYGKFEEEFLELPEEVLITSMREHQRYFPVKNKEGSLLPFFITIRNGDHNHIDNVAKGNEKVLRARLSDADFFYKEDQKANINDLLKKLDSIVYHEDLGTLGDKVRRIKDISAMVCSRLNLDSKTISLVERAAEICKFDLVTHMVYEFPELQGLMGEKYAKLKGENEAVALAINEHYMPRSADDEVPSSLIGSVISVADKLDTIVGCFAIGIIPTGSQDPYALRRQSAGIVQILLAKEWDVTLEELLLTTFDLFKDNSKVTRSREEILHDLVQFFKLRIKNELNNRSIRYDIIEAILGSEVGKISLLVKKAESIEKKKDSADFKETIEALSRVVRIAKNGEKHEIDPSLFASEEETALYNQYVKVNSNVTNALGEGNTDKAFEELSTLKNVIDAYFENTMVMTEDEAIKKNRLSQMCQLSEVIMQFADMNSIVVK